MFRLCFVWVYIIKGFCPFVKLASIGRLCKCTFLYACRIVSYVCPKSFFVKGNKTAYLGFYCRANFYDNMPSFLYILVKGLRWLTNVSSRHANVHKAWFGDRSILWYKFLGTTFLQLHIRIFNPCGVETLLSVFWFVRIFCPFRSVVVFISDFFAFKNQI